MLSTHPSQNKEGGARGGMLWLAKRKSDPTSSQAATEILHYPVPPPNK